MKIHESINQTNDSLTEEKYNDIVEKKFIHFW